MTEDPRQRANYRRLLAVVVAGALVIVGALVADRMLGREEEAQPPATSAETEPEETTPSEETAPPETVTTAPPTEPAPTGSTPLDVIAEAAPSSARIAWRTEVPTTGHVAVGSPDLGPARWLPPTPPGTSHALTVGSLSPQRTFRVWISSRAADGERAETSFDLTTPPGASVTASTGGGAVQLDGQPWFPLMAYGLCSHHIDTALSAGITLVALNPCGGLPEQLSVLQARALSAGAEGDETTDGPGLIGWFYPDEPDSRGMTGETLPALPLSPTFLTLTNHFYSGADPLPQGRGMYPGLIARADVVGFDLYPLQEWCQPGRLLDVEAAQRELVRLAAGKPTFQWIEASEMKCRETPGQEVTPDTVRVESWLAIVGGAVGLGFFPAAWTADVESAIRRVGDETAILAPALLGRSVPARVTKGPPTVRVAAWTDGRTVVAAAVNAARAPATASFSIGGTQARSLTLLGEGRTINAAGGVVTDSLPPLGVHVYLLPPGDA